MTVSELIGRLMELPQDADVYRFGSLFGDIEVGAVELDEEGRVVID